MSHDEVHTGSARRLRSKGGTNMRSAEHALLIKYGVRVQTKPVVRTQPVGEFDAILQGQL